MWMMYFFGSPNPLLNMDALNLIFDPNIISVGPPKINLGAEIKKYQVRSGKSH